MGRVKSRKRERIIRDAQNVLLCKKHELPIAYEWNLPKILCAISILTILASQFWTFFARNGIFIFGLELERENFHNYSYSNDNVNKTDELTVLVHHPKVDAVHLQHVRNVFERFGYKVTDDVNAEWDVLWSHDFPFISMADILENLKPHQVVNKMPGHSYITLKVNFVTSGALFIPPAFQFPQDREKFIQFRKENPKSQFLVKDNRHRSIKLVPSNKINLESSESFVQEFIPNPLLIDGRKFEFGIFVVVTSIYPLRLYRIQGDMIIRYSRYPYYPLDANNLSQYVISDDCLQYWESVEMKKYLKLSFSIQESFEATIESVGADPRAVWEQVDKAIVSSYMAREKYMIFELSKYRNYRNFFELIRFDFFLDDNFNLHALEANMSPNLSSMKYKQNAIIYEQVLQTLFSLVGISTYLHPPFHKQKYYGFP
ncbi:probable tubulin polyglutamylase ttll-15 isoform X2 [Neocloeon triangulifer]|uniref:probable tubulin polyglutamylase ttll-15 isoform X2 n=1 Tax=Neocloeon triangulifer TaxID=2078957 RepID=UPI00286F512C|nr:probable tubulin polyglutamylase ttll-15 isoform X2 [Neocloeon triangulifer]